MLQQSHSKEKDTRAASLLSVLILISVLAILAPRMAAPTAPASSSLSLYNLNCIPDSVLQVTVLNPLRELV